MTNLKQKTLVLIKPDAMKRGLGDEIIARIERTGLKVIERKEHQADETLAAAHYPVTDSWLEKVGKNTIDDCEKYGFSTIETMGTDVPKEIGKIVHNYNKEFLLSGPVLAMIVEGNHAIEIVRKLTGHTVPVLSPAGTIRGDFSNDSAVAANLEKRSIHNLIHASGEPEEAEREIKLWFGE